MSAFLGMRGTEDWEEDERPKSWREMILYLYPNGKAQLTAMLALMSKAGVTDPEFNWWTQVLESVAGAVTGVFTTAAADVAYVTGGIAGQILYIRIATTTATEIREGHQVLLRVVADSRVDVNGKVLSVVAEAGALTALIAVRLLENDNNSPSNDLSDCDRLVVIGNINPEGGEIPAAIAKNPAKFYNYTQIFRTPLEITRTARKTTLRTGNAYQRAKMEALETHSMEMEWNTLFGLRSERTGSNGKPERTSMGIVPFVRSNASNNVDDYRYSTNDVGTGATWLTSGEAWLDYMFEMLARYAAMENMVWLCGSGAIAGINKLAKNSGQMNLTAETTSYGLKVLNWVTPFGTVSLKSHPLLSQESSTRNMMIGVTPTDIKFRYIDDTNFYAEGEKTNTGHGRIDGTKEEYLTEGGYEFAHPEHFMVLDGIGKDNLLT